MALRALRARAFLRPRISTQRRTVYRVLIRAPQGRGAARCYRSCSYASTNPDPRHDGARRHLTAQDAQASCNSHCFAAHFREEAVRVVERFVTYYNNVRLHSAIGYLAPSDFLADRADEIFTARDVEAARESRRSRAWCRVTSLLPFLLLRFLRLLSTHPVAITLSQDSRNSRRGIRRAKSERAVPVSPHGGHVIQLTVALLRATRERRDCADRIARLERHSKFRHAVAR